MNTINLMGIFSAFLYLVIGWTNDNQQLSIQLFLCLMLLLFIMSIRLSHQAKQQAWEMTGKQTFAPLFLWAIVFRVIGLCFSPIYEDDHFRFLWDGFIFSEVGSPYGIAPSEFFGRELSHEPEVELLWQSILGQINYPDIPTIYGPITELCFLICYWILPGDVFALQALMVLFDVGILLLLMRLTPLYGWILYAWSPLIIKEFAFTAHPDVIAVFFMLGSFYCLKNHATKLSLTLISIACCTKVFALLMVPFILIHCSWRQWWIVPSIILAIYSPFLLAEGSGYQGMLAFAQDWEFNGSIHRLFTFALDNHTAKILGLGLFLCFASTYWGSTVIRCLQLKSYKVPRGDWIFGVFFLFSPVVNAWYCVWFIVFSAIYPSRWAWATSFCVLLSYVTGVTTENLGLALYQQPWWIVTMEYGIILLALIRDLQTRNQSLYWMDSRHQKLT